MHRSLALALGFALLAVAVSPGEPGAAGVYRWVDEAGDVHFGDRPPPGANTETLELPTRPASPAGQSATAAERRERQRKLLRAFEKERAEREEERTEARAARAERAKECAGLRKQLEGYKTAQFLYRKADDGSREILSDEARARYVAKLEARIARCP